MSISILQKTPIKVLILVAFSCFCVSLIAEDSAIMLEGDDARELVEELGLPTEITINKRAQALIAWSAFEKKIRTLSADESCKITHRVSDIMKNGTPEKRKRLLDLKINPIISIESCEESYKNLHNDCVKSTKEFYIHHYIHDTIAESSVIETLTRYTAFCPTARMLGVGDSAFKMHENVLKNK